MKLFRELPIQERLKICATCQSILAKHFPDSEYVITNHNKQNGFEFYRKKIDSFNGCVFECEDALIFFKRADVSSPYNKDSEFLKVYSEGHNPLGNCLFVDFIAADITEKNYSKLYDFFFRTKGVEYVMASRRGTIILDNVANLKAKAEKIGAMKLIASLAP